MLQEQDLNNLQVPQAIVDNQTCGKGALPGLLFLFLKIDICNLLRKLCCRQWDQPKMYLPETSLHVVPATAILSRSGSPMAQQLQSHSRHGLMISAAAGAPRTEARTATRTRSIVVVGDQLRISAGTRLCIICRYISDILLPDNGSDAALASPPSPALTATMHHHRGGSRHAQASHFYQTLVTRHVSFVWRCS